MKTFPMFLQMAGRRVVIVGGGEQAAQKTRLMLKTEAAILVLAPALDEELAGLHAAGRIDWSDARVTAAAFEGTALGRQELMGELVESRTGALWDRAAIEAARVRAAPPLARVVVAVDPPATSGAGADECGLVVAGVGEDGIAYVLEDASMGGLSPAGWAERAVRLYRAHEADRIVAEVNQGGEMVEAVIRMADPSVPVRPVRASRGKRVRAEPVAALYERGRVRHAGAFPMLEDQLCAFTGAPGEASPDRLDALVWALTDLMLGPGPAMPSVRTL